MSRTFAAFGWALLLATSAFGIFALGTLASSWTASAVAGAYGEAKVSPAHWNSAIWIGSEVATGVFVFVFIALRWVANRFESSRRGRSAD